MSDSDFRTPVVRHFIACEDVKKSSEGRPRSLINLVDIIEVERGYSYPVLLPQLCLFTRKTNGRGQHSFQIKMVGDDGESTRMTKSVILNLANDPLEIHRCIFRLNKIVLPKAGLYEFRLLCNGHEIALEYIQLREAP